MILSDDEMGSMELSTALENGTATAVPANSGVERRLRSSASSASWASHPPLEAGTRVMCRWRDQKPHPIKVIERRKSSSYSSPADYEYYVHYTEFNRRLDEWVKLEQLDLDTVEADVDEQVEDKATSLKMKRHQKRKIDETHVESKTLVSMLVLSGRGGAGDEDAGFEP